jgi:hypothetical protein
MLLTEPPLTAVVTFEEAYKHACAPMDAEFMGAEFMGRVKVGRETAVSTTPQSISALSPHFRVHSLVGAWT